MPVALRARLGDCHTADALYNLVDLERNDGAELEARVEILLADARWFFRDHPAEKGRRAVQRWRGRCEDVGGRSGRRGRRNWRWRMDGIAVGALLNGSEARTRRRDGRRDENLRHSR